VRLAVTPSRISTQRSMNVSKTWRWWGSVWRIWSAWSRMTTSSFSATCANILAW
jgi:hypothetical protein